MFRIKSICFGALVGLALGSSPLLASQELGELDDYYPIHQILPDKLGNKAVWVARRWEQKKKGYTYELVLANLVTQKNKNLGVLPFSFGQKLIWGAKTESVLFVETSKEDALLQERSIATGKTATLAKFTTRKVLDLALQPEGPQIALIYSKQEKPSSLAQVSQPSASSQQGLMIWNRATGRTVEIDPAIFPNHKTVSVGGVAWVPGSRPRLVVEVRAGDSYREQFHSSVYEVDVIAQRAVLVSDPQVDASGAVVSQDGRWVAYSVGLRAPLDPYSVFQLAQIEVYDRQTLARRKLPVTWDAQPQLKGFSPDASALLYTESKQGKLAIHRLNLKTLQTITWADSSKSSEFMVHLGPGGQWLGLVTESAGCAPRPLLVNASLLEKKEPHYPTRCEPGLEDLEVTWEAKDGRKIYGIVNRPASGAKGPLLVIPHGGPTFLSFYEYLGTYYHHGVPIDIRAFVRAGYTVLRPNIRGSMSYGPEYRQANWKDLGGKDWQDVESGIEDLVKRGWVEKNHYAIAGWSYGGFLCAHGATQTQLFRAAACGAAITDWISHDHTSDFSFYVPWYFGREPGDLASLYPLLVSRSPALSEAKTGAPLLVIHGKEDRAVDFGQGQALYRWAERRGVPAKLLAYPGEGHGFERLDHIREAANEVTSWVFGHMESH